MELMNREKNYNQVFNANPLVGVLNPLATKVSNQVLVILLVCPNRVLNPLATKVSIVLN